MPYQYPYSPCNKLLQQYRDEICDFLAPRNIIEALRTRYLLCSSRIMQSIPDFEESRAYDVNQSIMDIISRKQFVILYLEVFVELLRCEGIQDCDVLANQLSLGIEDCRSQYKKDYETFSTERSK
ncbi:hypothetical protein TrispH2_004925 [Trichoplax sp. H2]|uniref:Uncharacterized protein n=1 Tax=Trichoplax adhaerens TaxID=10228 RepID=B3RUP3_TRIAD|nr:predicted protein [Trichoplax adhaerens]EDV25857.1 predicted protein [Trichoplax adhaerens]RDD42945.1 hypothetical protein TrispH2_004925 [Trichoplax sp. H2]|eukprot:XP_002111890.1 predicted protein [Trichoplax adhaerens]